MSQPVEKDNPWAKISPNEIDFCFTDPRFLGHLRDINKRTLQELERHPCSRSALYLVTSEYTQFILSRGILPSEGFMQTARAGFLQDLTQWKELLRDGPIDVLKPGVDRWHFSWQKPPHPDFPNILPLADMYLAFLAIRHCRKAYDDPLQYTDRGFYLNQQRETQMLLSRTERALKLSSSDVRGDIGAVERMAVAMLFTDKQPG